ncbi:MAG: tetratricopeptide repeat protein [Elusimicrobiota bacterium]|nr:tetratricopeptide repeat protein [Elusimicrobiota bacterium]
MNFKVGKKSVLIYVITLVFILAGIGCFKFLYKSRETKAVEKLSGAYVFFSRGDQNTGAALIDETIAQYAATPAAYQASLIKADLLTQQRNFDEALQLLQNVVANGIPYDIRHLASSRIINIYDAQQDYFNAINAANQFVNNYPNSFLVKDVYLNLAVCYITTGSRDLGVKTLNVILEKFPATREAERAQNILYQLK